MTPVPSTSSGPTLVADAATRRVNPRPIVRTAEDAHRRTSSSSTMTDDGVIGGERHGRSQAALLGDVIAQIDRARVLIHTCCAGARPALMNELDDVADDLDAAIRRFEDAALAGHTVFSTGSPALPLIHRAWSEVERQWITMTFHEHQAWLARPDLDPGAFASRQTAI